MARPGLGWDPGEGAGTLGRKRSGTDPAWQDMISAPIVRTVHSRPHLFDMTAVIRWR